MAFIIKDKLFYIFLFIVFLCSFQVEANYKAGHFVGLYRITSQFQGVESEEYLLVDVGPLLTIWRKYFHENLPEHLESYRNEPTILAGFTHRSFAILSFENLSLITDTYLRVSGSRGTMIELLRRQNGRYETAARQKGQVTKYRLEPPRALPAGP